MNGRIVNRYYAIIWCGNYWEILMTAKENKRLANQLLLLFVLVTARRLNRYIGKTLLTKVFFLAERELGIKKQIGLPSYKFYRYSWGPFSKGLYEDLGILRESRLVFTSGKMATMHGTRFIESVREELSKQDDWETVLSTLERKYYKYKKYTAQEIAERVYDLRVRPVNHSKSMKVRDIPQFTDLLDPELDPNLLNLELPESIAEAFYYAISLTDYDINRMKTGPFMTKEDFLKEFSTL